MTNLNGENTTEILNEDKGKEKNKEEEETTVIEPIINLLQQLEDYTPTVRIPCNVNYWVHRFIALI